MQYQCVYVNPVTCPNMSTDDPKQGFSPDAYNLQFRPNCDGMCISHPIRSVRMSDARIGFKTTRCESYKDAHCGELLRSSGDSPGAWRLGSPWHTRTRMMEQCADLGHGKSFRCFHGCGTLDE